MGFFFVSRHTFLYWLKFFLEFLQIMLRCYRVTPLDLISVTMVQKVRVLSQKVTYIKVIIKIKDDIFPTRYLELNQNSWEKLTCFIDLRIKKMPIHEIIHLRSVPSEPFCNYVEYIFSCCSYYNRNTNSWYDYVIISLSLCLVNLAMFVSLNHTVNY